MWSRVIFYVREDDLFCLWHSSNTAKYKKTGALLYAVGCSTYSVAQVNESAAYLFFANIRYLNNVSSTKYKCLKIW